MFGNREDSLFESNISFFLLGNVDDEAELEWKRDVQLGKTIKAIQEFVGSAGITMEWEIVGF